MANSENPASSKIVGGSPASASNRSRLDVLQALFPDNSIFFKTLTQSRHPFINTMGVAEDSVGYYPLNLIVNCLEKDFDSYGWLSEIYKKLSDIRTNNSDFTTLALGTFRNKGTIGLSYSVAQDPIVGDSIPSRFFNVQVRKEGSSQYSTTPTKIFRNIAANYVVKKIASKDSALTPNLANIIGFILSMGLDEQWLEKSQNWLSMLLSHLMNTHFRATIFKIYAVVSKILFNSKKNSFATLDTNEAKGIWEVMFSGAANKTPGDFDLKIPVIDKNVQGALDVIIPHDFAVNGIRLLLEHIQTPTPFGEFLLKIVSYVESEFGELRYSDMLRQNILNDFDKPGSFRPQFVQSALPFVIDKNEFNDIQENAKYICHCLTNVRNISFELETNATDTFVPASFITEENNSALFYFSGFFGLLTCCDDMWEEPIKKQSTTRQARSSAFKNIFGSNHPKLKTIEHLTYGFLSIPHRYVLPLWSFATKNVIGTYPIQFVAIATSATKEPMTSTSAGQMFNYFKILDTEASVTTPKLPVRTKYLFPKNVYLFKEPVSGGALCDISGSKFKFVDVKSNLFVCEVARLLSEAFRYSLSSMFQHYQSKVVGIVIPDSDSYETAVEAETDLIKMVYTKTKLQRSFYMFMQKMFSKDLVSSKALLNLVYNDSKDIFEIVTFLSNCFNNYLTFVSDFDDASDRDRILMIAPAVKKLLETVLSELTCYSASGDVLPYCDTQYTTSTFTLFSPAPSCTRYNSLKFSTGGLADVTKDTLMQLSSFVEAVSTKTPKTHTIDKLHPAFLTVNLNSFYFKSCLSIDYEFGKGEFNLSGIRNRPGNALFSNYTTSGKAMSIFPIQPQQILMFAENLGCTMTDLSVVTDSVNTDAVVKILAIVKDTVPGVQGTTQRVFWCSSSPAALTRTATVETFKYVSIVDKTEQVSFSNNLRFANIVLSNSKPKGIEFLEESNRETQEDATTVFDPQVEVFPKLFSYIPGCTQSSCFFKRQTISSVQLNAVVLDLGKDNTTGDVSSTYFITKILDEFCSSRIQYLVEKSDFKFTGSTIFTVEKPSAKSEENAKTQSQGNKANEQMVDAEKVKEKEKTKDKENEVEKKKENIVIPVKKEDITPDDSLIHGNFAFSIDLSSFTDLSEAANTIKVEVGDSLFNISKIDKTNSFKKN